MTSTGRRARGSFSPSRTFWLFLSQVLAADRACRETVRKFLLWLGLLEEKTASPQTAAYCNARARLPLPQIQQAHDQVVQNLHRSSHSQTLWHGRSVKVIDGSSVSMPDTPQNQLAYPQPSCQKPGCGFPVMRIAAVFSLATGALLHLAHSALNVGERRLFQRLWALLDPGDVVLCDRGFCDYASLYLLFQRGVDSVMRNHQRRKTGLRVIKRFNKMDRLIEWHKTGNIPKWMDKTDWLAMPDFLRLREIAFSVSIPGFRTQSITLVTTLLDPKRFPTQAFADLYRRRWMAELFLRDIKTTMGFAILRCKTPAMIEKELRMHLIAYNLVRALILQAAREHRVEPFRISFKGAIATLRQWAPILAAAHLGETKRQWLARLLREYLARDLLPKRPNRTEPRSIKRRPKNYPLLTNHRRLYREIPHRKQYTKAKKSLS